MIKLLFVLSALVSPGDVDSIPSVRLPSVEVSGQRPDGKEVISVFETPQAVSLVSNQLIADKMQFDLREVITSVAGVNAYSGFDEYTIRGLRAENARMFNGLRGYNSLYTSAMMTNVERVEILKGPVALFYGNGDPGGTVNLISKKPEEDSFREISLLAGSYNHWRVQTDWTGAITPDKKLLYRFNAGYDQSQPYRLLTTARNWQVAPSFSWFPTNKIQVYADFVVSGVNSQIDRGQPGREGSTDLRSTPKKYTLTGKEDYLRESNVASSLRLNYQITRQLVFHAGYLNYIVNQSAKEHIFAGYTGTGGIDTNLDRWKYNTMTNSLSGYLTYQTKTGPLKHNLLFGYDFIHSDGDIDRYIYTEPDPEEYYTHGIYLQDEITWGKWKLLIGVRHESYTGEEEDEGMEDSDDDEEEFNQRIWLPQLALSYQPIPQMNLYITYHKGFDPFEAVNERQRFNTTFKPIVSELWEAGIKSSLWDNRLMASVAFYQIKVKNTAVNANDPTQPDLYVQRGEDRSRGVEFEVNGEVFPGLEVNVNYAFNRAKVTKSNVPEEIGHTRENAPRHSSNSWVKYTWQNSPLKGLSIALGHSVVSSRSTLQQDLVLPGYGILNAGLGYSFRNMAVSLYMENLTNRTYWTAAYNNVQKWVGKPRNFMVGINYQF